MKTEPIENGIIFTGDLRECLKNQGEGCIQTCVTSPPYYGLRNYGTEPLIWGGIDTCNHVWGDVIPGSNRGGSGTPTNKSGRGEGYGRASTRGRFCKRCGAWEGHLGLEPTLDLYIDHLVEVFRHVRRVLHGSGTLWLNLGDSYASSPEKAKLANLKPKDMLMVPHRVAMALQEDGWWLRSVCPWVKANGLPESVRSRPTSSVEYWFMFSKSSDYYYDIDAIRIPENGRARRNSDWFFETARGYADELNAFVFESGRALIGSSDGEHDEIQAFYANPEPLKGAHFATFPTKVIEPIIRACSSEVGGCKLCFSPFVRDGEGWKKTCECDSGDVPYPQIVLDCFGGSGTTGVVSETWGRRWRLCELNPSFVDLSKDRIVKHCRKLDGLEPQELEAGQKSLF